MNNQIERLRLNLIEQLNNCELPIGVAYYVYRDVLVELEKIYNQSLLEEQQTKEE